MHKILIALPLLLPLAASAADGAYEINQDCAAAGCFAGDAPGFPVTISQPGRYVLTSDLVPPGAAGTVTVIDGAAAFVDLDLGGHAIDGGQTCSGTPVASCTNGPGSRGIDMIAPPFQPMVLHVHDGKVHGFATAGLLAQNLAEGSVIERVTATENGFGVGVAGILPTVTVRVRDSQLSRNSFGGVTGVNTNARLFVENCAVVANKSIGITLISGSLAFGNRIESNGGVGIDCSGAGTICAVGQNVLQGNNGGGAAAQWSITTARDMGANVCLDDGTCP
jgi:hypothetical protein